MLSDDEISRLSAVQRHELARRLLARDPHSSASAGRRQRSLFLSLVAVACLVLLPWIVFLALTLPKSYVVQRWTAVWTGFDVALLTTIAACFWAAWRRRQVLIVFALIGATLLTCDAWFDIMTASTSGDLRISLASAFLVELPFAVVLMMVARRLLRLTLHRAHHRAGLVDPSTPFYKIAILGLEVEEMAPAGADPPDSDVRGD